MSKVILFDADSLIYQAIYKVVTFGEIRALLQKGESRYAIELEILQRGYDRFEKMYFDIHNEIEETVQVSETKYFFTDCKKNFRKEIDPNYKANRKRNKWVSDLRKYLIDYLPNSFASDEFEADDLIYYNSQLYDVNDYIICSIDKDLKQIEGLHFDYYQMKLKDENGEYIIDEFGKEVKKRKGFIQISKEQAENLVFEMMLTGDVSDNIKGIYGIGKVKATKLLLNRSKWGKFRVLCEEYKKESDDWKTRIKINAQLLMFN
jgi:5'-3' exonuclease